MSDRRRPKNEIQEAAKAWPRHWPRGSKPHTIPSEKIMHPSAKALLKHFRYDHLPPMLQETSAPLCNIAHQFAEHLEGPELTVGLRKLLEAKDCFVRAKLSMIEEKAEGL